MHDRSTERDYYAEMWDRVEPDLAIIDTGAGLASISISLKRLADAAEAAVRMLREVHKKKVRGSKEM